MTVSTRNYEESHLIHQNFDPGIQPRCNGFIQCALEPFLFLHGTIQKICLVDIGGLGSSEIALPLVGMPTREPAGITHQLFVKVDLNHRLNRVTDVDQFKELE